MKQYILFLTARNTSQSTITLQLKIQYCNLKVSFANTKMILRIPIICQLFCQNHVPGYETLSCNRKNKQSRSGNKLKIELLDAANSSKQFI